MNIRNYYGPQGAGKTRAGEAFAKAMRAKGHKVEVHCLDGDTIEGLNAYVASVKCQVLILDGVLPTGINFNCQKIEVSREKGFVLNG